MRTKRKTKTAFLIALLVLTAGCHLRQIDEPCCVLDFYGVPRAAMVSKVRNVLSGLEPWREVAIHWVDNGKHQTTSYYSYEELRKGFAEIKDVWTVVVYCGFTADERI